MSNQAPFRYDVVGSFLRPEYLKDARAKFAEGKITEEQLKETEDKAIKELVEKKRSRTSGCDRWGIQKKILAFGFPCRSGWCRGD